MLAEKVAFEIGYFHTFRTSMTVTMTLDWVTRHIVGYRSSTSTSNQISFKSGKLCVDRWTLGGVNIKNVTSFHSKSVLVAEAASRKHRSSHQILLKHTSAFIGSYPPNKLPTEIPSSFCQPHSVHCPPGSPHPAHIISSQSPPSLSSPITASTFHSRLKTHLFHKSFPP